MTGRGLVFRKRVRVGGRPTWEVPSRHQDESPRAPEPSPVVDLLAGLACLPGSTGDTGERAGGCALHRRIHLADDPACVSAVDPGPGVPADRCRFCVNPVRQRPDFERHGHAVTGSVFDDARRDFGDSGLELDAPAHVQRVVHPQVREEFVETSSRLSGRPRDRR